MAGFVIRVVDTGALAATHGFAIEAAALALEDEADIEEAEARATQAGAESVLIGVIDSVGYLERSGRVPWLMGRTADFVGIKPIISFAEGRPRMVGRARTMERAMGRVVRLVAEDLGASSMAEMVILHAASEERAEKLAEATRTSSDH
jgi:fatty acid-binding protein DegV